MHLNSELLFKAYALNYFTNGTKVLEIGPDAFPSAYRNAVKNTAIEWDTIDFEHTAYIGSAVNNLTYKLESPYQFPLASETYDIILSGQVIEHVEKIWIWLEELKRVLKKGGCIITINPVSWPYHEAPIDCWRIFPSGIRALADDLDLTVELSLYESLEERDLKRLDPKIKTVPGTSYACPVENIKKVKRIIKRNRLIRSLPFYKDYFEVPIQVAYDTISILRK